MPELKEVIVGVHCTFNELIPSYSDESTAESFDLIGERYLDDKTRLEYATTRVAVYKGLIVAYRAPVLSTGHVGIEEKSPIHVADVVRMMSETNPAKRGSGGESASEKNLCGLVENTKTPGVVKLEGAKMARQSKYPNADALTEIFCLAV